MNKPALFFAGITTALGIYVVSGMPTIITKSEIKQQVKIPAPAEGVYKQFSEEHATPGKPVLPESDNSSVADSTTFEEESSSSITQEEPAEDAIPQETEQANTDVEQPTNVADGQSFEATLEPPIKDIDTNSTEENKDTSEETTEQQAAYNPETGEINWDCPCLGGMAHGPCGEEFKSAFSCFVYSEAEPKGIDCVEKFQHMQDCFRKYPEYYAEQIKDEEAAAAEAEKLEQSQVSKDASASVAAEVETENALFEPVLEKYGEENSTVEDAAKTESEAQSEGPKSG